MYQDVNFCISTEVDAIEVAYPYCLETTILKSLYFEFGYL